MSRPEEMQEIYNATMDLIVKKFGANIYSKACVELSSAN